MKELSENEIQRAVFSHLRTRGAPGIFAFHPKNASSDMRGRRRGIYAGLGIVPGIPDVIVIRSVPCFEMVPLASVSPASRVYALELKREVHRGKKPTEHDEKQKKCRENMESCGVVQAVAYGLDEAIAWLEDRGILRGKSSS
jgi:hypothetical protein